MILKRLYSKATSSNFSNTIGGVFSLHDGYAIPRVGLGISRIPNQEDLNIAVEGALKAGYRLFDTANMYKNEQFLGVSLRKFLPKFGLTRADVFITTKVRTLNDNTLEETEKQFNESLEKLQTDYLDLLLVHYPRDRDTGKDSEYDKNKSGRKIVWQFLENAKELGITRSIGVSNFEIYHLVELFSFAKFKPVINQCEYQPYLTRPTLRKFCELNNIVVQAYSSLCAGDQEILKEPVVVALAQKYNVSAQAILYAFGYSSNTSIIPKSVTPSRIHENLHTTISIPLTPDELNLLSVLDKSKSFRTVGNTWACL